MSTSLYLYVGAATSTSGFCPPKRPESFEELDELFNRIFAGHSALLSDESNPMTAMDWVRVKDSRHEVAVLRHLWVAAVAFHLQGPLKLSPRAIMQHIDRDRLCYYNSMRKAAALITTSAPVRSMASSMCLQMATPLSELLKFCDNV